MIPAVIEKCAGIDVSRRFVEVCVMTGEAPEVPGEQARRFSTLNEDLERMREWPYEHGVTHVVMETWSATRKKNSEPQRYYERLKPRLKHKPALIATAHLLTGKLYQALATGKPYAEDPEPQLTAAKAQRLVRHHTHRLKKLNRRLSGHLSEYFQSNTDKRR